MTTTTPASVDPTRCPLCGQPNQCVMAEAAACGRACTSPCWCETAQFPESLLAQVPEAARRRACICAACASAAPAHSSPTDDKKDLP